MFIIFLSLLSIFEYDCSLRLFFLSITMHDCRNVFVLPQGMLLFNFYLYHEYLGRNARLCTIKG